MVMQVRNLIPWSTVPQISERTIYKVARAKTRIQEASVATSCFRTLPTDFQHLRKFFKLLRHDLSEVLVESYGWPAECKRSSYSERHSLENWRTGLSDGYISARKLERLNLALEPNAGGLRVGAIGLGCGNYPLIQLCNFEDALYAYQKLAERMKDGNEHCFLLDAIVEFVCINSYHLFQDGNGRTSRAIFNYRLWQKGLPCNSYIPLKELFWLSRGGYEIRFRQAEIENEWDPLVGYLSDLISIALPVNCKSTISSPRPNYHRDESALIEVSA